MKAIGSNTQIPLSVFNSGMSVVNKITDVVCESFFSTTPATEDEIRKEITVLKTVWNKPNAFWAVLSLTIEESKISKERLHYSVSQMLQTHTYGQSFTPAELLSFDKKITMGKTLTALKQKLGYDVDIDDIAIIEWNQMRMFALLEDAIEYGKNILIRYVNGKQNFVGAFAKESVSDILQRLSQQIDAAKKANMKEDAIVPNYILIALQRLKPQEKIFFPLFVRQQEFYQRLIPFLEDYPKEIVRKFYDYWSTPVECGDVMRKEVDWSWMRKHNGQAVDLTDEKFYEFIDKIPRKNERKS